jgi:hypothetical protein
MEGVDDPFRRVPITSSISKGTEKMRIRAHAGCGPFLKSFLKGVSKVEGMVHSMLTGMHGGSFGTSAYVHSLNRQVTHLWLPSPDVNRASSYAISSDTVQHGNSHSCL